MTIQIKGKIVNFKVKSDAPATPPASTAAAPVSERPQVLHGTTYKLKSALLDHAMYITINDIEVGGHTRPFEIFINTKDSTHYQWMVALTRLMSAVFRKGGDLDFLVEELNSIFDPRGGVFGNGRFYPSVLAQIGEIVEQHLKKLGLIGGREPSPEAQALIAQKKEASMPGANLCPKCYDKALVKMEGCETCMSCGFSKCG